MPNVMFVCIFEQGNQVTGSIDSGRNLNGMMFSTLDRNNDIYAVLFTVPLGTKGDGGLTAVVMLS